MYLMKKLFYQIYCLFFLVLVKETVAQKLPIYSDYLSDNVYLLHPTAAGIGNSSKLRFTTRQQWVGIDNAPALQTISFHSRFNYEYPRGAAYGFIAFNDRNGFQSQKGFQGTYAYHLPITVDRFFNQLSFGLSFSLIQNQSDRTSFRNRGDIIGGNIIATNFLNADFGVAYHYGGFSSYFSVKNLFLTQANNQNINKATGLRNFIFSFGYYFGEEKFIQLEPSVLFQLRQATGERIADLNLKAYRTFGNKQLWAAVSYRQSFDENTIEDLRLFTPIIGINFNKMMFSYTYTQQLNDIVLTNSGFHQITIGFNLWTVEPRAAGCPNIASPFGSF